MPAGRVGIHRLAAEGVGTHRLAAEGVGTHRLAVGEAYFYMEYCELYFKCIF